MASTTVRVSTETHALLRKLGFRAAGRDGHVLEFALALRDEVVARLRAAAGALS